MLHLFPDLYLIGLTLKQLLNQFTVLSLANRVDLHQSSVELLHLRTMPRLAHIA